MKALTAHEVWLSTTRHIARKERSQILRNYISSIFKGFCIAYLASAIALMAWIGINFKPDMSQQCAGHLSKPLIERLSSRLK